MSGETVELPADVIAFPTLRTLWQLTDEEMGPVPVETLAELAEGLRMEREIGPIMIGTARTLRNNLTVRAADGDVDFQMEVLMRRLIVMAPEAEFSVLALATAVALSHNVGVVVLWAHSLAVLAQELGRPVLMDDLVVRFQSQGRWRIPRRDSYRALWLEQKIPIEILRARRDAKLPGSDNYVDYRQTWPEVGTTDYPSMSEVGVSR